MPKKTAISDAIKSLDIGKPFNLKGAKAPVLRPKVKVHQEEETQSEVAQVTTSPTSGELNGC